MRRKSLKQLFFYKTAQKWYTNVPIDEKTTFYPLNVANFTTGTQGDRPCNFTFCYKDPLQIPISNITLIIDFWKATFSLLNLNSSQNHWKTIMNI